MSAIDVEGLFRKFTISEVKDIEKKVKADIERKKEDLRQMVGRRYRDIIEAADSINAMQRSSEHVLASIRHIEQNVESLHNVQQQLIAATHRAKFQGNPNANATASMEPSAKCISDLLELVDQCLFDQQPLDAAWCFVIAEYLYRAWKMNYSQSRDASSESGTITSAFLTKRFASAGRLRQAIINASIDFASDCSKPMEIILDAVCSLAFVERTNLENVFQRLLQCRKDALQSLFTNLDNSSREQICTGLCILKKTVLQLYQLFMPLGDSADETSRLLDKMRSLISSHWQPAIFEQARKRQPRLYNAAFPDNFDYSKVFTVNSSLDVDAAKVCELSKAWVKDAMTYSSAKLNELVRNFDTIESLTVVKENMILALALEPFESVEWSTACQKILGQDLSLWLALCSQPLEERIKELLRRDVDAAFGEAIEQGHFENISMEHKIELPGRVMISGDWWREQRTDTVMANVYSTLQLKSRGLTQEIYRPASELNKRIEVIDKALSEFLFVHDAKRSEPVRFFALNDNNLQQTLAEICVAAIERFVTEINKKGIEWKSVALAASEEKDETARFGAVRSLIMAAKFMQCFSDSTGAIKQCILRPYGTISKVKDTTRELDKWSALRASLNGCAAQLYRSWADYVIANVSASFRKRLLMATNNVGVWIDCVQEWEAIEIEEETEEGQKVVSTIYVPSSCSSFVSDLLRDVVRCILDVGAHSLHSDILAAISKLLRSAVVQNFETALSDTPSQLRQKQAIQLLFDFTLLTQMLHSTSSNPAEQHDANITTRIQRIVERLESMVDPFDLDVLKPRLKRNVTKVLNKSQALYRTLYTPESMRASSVVSKASTVGSGGTEPSHIVPLATCQTRFYLLPVIGESEKASSGNLGRLSTTSQLPTSNVESTPIGLDDRTKNTASAIQQHSRRSQTPASSFYDKLTSGWFGHN